MGRGKSEGDNRVSTHINLLPSIIKRVDEFLDKTDRKGKHRSRSRLIEFLLTEHLNGYEGVWKNE